MFVEKMWKSFRRSIEGEKGRNGGNGSMKRLVSTSNLDKKEWLKYRKQGIGGSDAGAVAD